MAAPTQMRPNAVEIRDVQRVKTALTDLLIKTGIYEATLTGTLPWGFMTERERRGWLSDVERAAADLDEARRKTLIAARTATNEGDQW